MGMEPDELKEWIKIDYGDEDTTLSSLIFSSEMIIQEATGVKLEDVEVYTQEQLTAMPVEQLNSIAENKNVTNYANMQSNELINAILSKNDKKFFSLYTLIQKIIITGLYENRDGEAKENKGLISLYMQLEAYKLQQNAAATADITEATQS